MASGIARQVHDYLSEDSAWYLDKLHTCLTLRRRGQQPDLTFLESKRAEKLAGLRQGILERGLRALATGDLRMLEKAVAELQARVRKERSW